MYKLFKSHTHTQRMHRDTSHYQILIKAIKYFSNDDFIIRRYSAINISFCSKRTLVCFICNKFFYLFIFLLDLYITYIKIYVNYFKFKIFLIQIPFYILLMKKINNQIKKSHYNIKEYLFKNYSLQRARSKDILTN